MRICLVSETWLPDINGVAHTLNQLSRELLARGVSLQLVRPTPAGASGGARRAAGMQAELQVPGLALPGYREVRIGLPATRRLQRLWREQRPDVVYLATQGPLGWSARRAARRLSIPVVAGWHTNFDHYCHDYRATWLAPIIRNALRHFHNGCAATLVPTRLQAETLRESGFQRLAVMGRGIDGQRRHLRVSLTLRNLGQCSDGSHGQRSCRARLSPRRSGRADRKQRQRHDH